jgi:hypothetical protein
MVRWFAALGIAVLSLAACSRGEGTVARQQATAESSTRPVTPSPVPRDIASPARTRDNGGRSNIGFRSRVQFNEHFQKHGAEFGRISQVEYLRLAQTLRDAPVGGRIEEIRRSDGTVSRFDRSTGAFIAFDRDGTIRTFFKPNDGEAYFRRQAMRVH